MTTTLVIVGLIFLAGAVVLLTSVCRAPQGYEDKDGFHHGQRPRRG